MVFFNCNACGEALKKNQVDKHLSRCRQCQSLSCVDCGKDFWGNDYQSHTKCMTEDEKYCGKAYVPKVNKGEVKQEQWIEKVQGAIEKSATNPNLKGLLERLKDYPNIPRKKQKFENFLKNSLRVNSQALIAQVWDLLMAAAGNPNDTQNGSDSPEKTTTNGTVSHKAASVESQDSTATEEVLDTENSNQKLSKRERKEERRKKANKKEKKDRKTDDDADKMEKGKKRKHSENGEDGHEDFTSAGATLDSVHSNSAQVEKVKKKKKKRQKSESTLEDSGPLDSSSISGPPEDDDDVEAAEEPKKKRKKTKFDWEAVITKVLKSKGEMTLKKLRKKVLNEFAAQDAANYADENLQAKFEKKLKKLQHVKVFKVA